MRTPALNALLRAILPTLSGCLALTLPTTQAEEVHRWQDARGQAIYGDVPPASARSRPLEAGLPPESGSPRAENGEETAAQSPPGRKKQAAVSPEKVDAQRAQPRAAHETPPTRRVAQSGHSSLRSHPDCQRAHAQIYVLENGAQKRSQTAFGQDKGSRAAEIARLRDFLQGCGG